MSETARAEVNSDPYPTVTAIGKDVHIVIAASNGTQLCPRFFHQGCGFRFLWQKAPRM
jgi:hypothetical protein